MRLFGILLFAMAIMTLGTTSCSKKSTVNCGSFGWGVAVQDEITTLSNASAAYSQNPTTENCNAYRQAYIDYINALRDYDKCVQSADRADWQQALDDAEQEANNIQC